MKLLVCAASPADAAALEALRRALEPGELCSVAEAMRPNGAGHGPAAGTPSQVGWRWWEAPPCVHIFIGCLQMSSRICAFLVFAQYLGLSGFP